jgi:hypothetical protein
MQLLLNILIPNVSFPKGGWKKIKGGGKGDGSLSPMEVTSARGGANDVEYLLM